MAKSENMTMRVTLELKTRAENLKKKYHDEMPMTIFLQKMLILGLDVQEEIGEHEMRIKIEAVRTVSEKKKEPDVETYPYPDFEKAMRIG